MKTARHLRRAFSAALVALAFAATPSFGQEKSAGGLVINIGLMTAAKAMQVDGHREAHEHAFTNSSAAEHLLVTIKDAKTGRRIGDARVVVEVKDPQGKVESRPMLRTQSAGLADYSEIFQFGWTGKYEIRVAVTPAPDKKPIEARFKVDYSI
jgi:hypothetical protein